MSSVNGLTEAQEERLTKLIEECSEIIKVACKIQLHGYQSVNPYAPQDGTNLHQLHLEMGDYETIKRLMLKNGDIELSPILDRAIDKYPKLKKSLRQEHTF